MINDIRFSDNYLFKPMKILDECFASSIYKSFSVAYNFFQSSSIEIENGFHSFCWIAEE